LFKAKSLKLKLEYATLSLIYGSILTGLGSAYYHINPYNETLFWDRLPMAICFASVFILFIAGQMDPNLSSSHFLFYCAQFIAISSCVWWRLKDDLGPYLVIQIMPIIIFPFIRLWYPIRFNLQSLIDLSVILYIFAKLAEVQDKFIYKVTSHTVSGHVLKHILAGITLFLMIKVAIERKVLLTLQSKNKSKKS